MKCQYRRVLNDAVVGDWYDFPDEEKDSDIGTLEDLMRYLGKCGQDNPVMREVMFCPVPGQTSGIYENIEDRRWQYRFVESESRHSSQLPLPPFARKFV